MRRGCQIPIASLGLAALAALLPALSTQAHAQRVFDKGPYLQAVSPTAMTVMWQTAGRGGEVTYRDAAGAERTVQAGGGGGVREARLSGLSASSTYSYTARSDGQESERSEFVTAPGRDEPFTFLVYGDNRSDHDQHQQVIDAMVVEGGDFGINTGDMVSDGEDEAHWQRFFEIEYDLLRGVPIYPAIGNHEEHNGEAELFLKYFAPPTEATGREEYYAFTYGNTRFLVMDTHVKTILGGPDFEQGAWLDEELANDDPAIEHTFVVMHHGPYSSKPGRTGNLGVNVFWMDKFRDAGVDMVLSGHDHYYERGEDQRGMRYAIVGGGGAPLYDTDGPGNRDGREIFVSQGILSYVTMTVFGGRVEGCAKDTAGAVIECFEWGEGEIPDEQDPPPGPDPQPDPEPDPDPNPQPDPNPDPAPGAVECLADGDCFGRDDMAHCAGRWQCSAEACEWACDQADPGPDEDPTPTPDPDPDPVPVHDSPADDPAPQPGPLGGGGGGSGEGGSGEGGVDVPDEPQVGSSSSGCAAVPGTWGRALKGLLRR